MWVTMPLLATETSQLEGRAQELAALSDALDSAFAGQGRLVVVSGEAGIGKSALVSSLAERATARGAVTVWGRAWEFADAPAYFPLWPCLAALGLSSAETQSAAPFAVWEGVLGALSTATRERPQVWLLEDLHAADVQTLDLLTFLAQPLRVLKLLLVVTTRPQDPRLCERAEQRLLRLARDGVDLRLAPLPAASVERLTRRLAGDVSERTLAQLLELTSGNPLFVVECARAIKSGGAAALSSVSPTIRQVVLERLRLLPETTQHLLESAAVLGRDFTAALLGRMHQLLPSQVVDGLLPALRSGVVLERQPGSYVFSHVVVQDAVYSSLAQERRSALHVLAARALAQLPDAPEILLERARHALGGLTQQTEAHALALLFRAGQSLESSGAFDRAHALYARLRDKLAAGELATALSGQQLLHLASVAERAGKGSEGRKLSLQVLERVRKSQDALLFAAAALELGRTLRAGLIDAQLVAALREALDILPEQEASLRCRVLARLAAALQPHADPQLPVRMATEAIAQAQQLADPSLLVDVLDVAGSAYVEYAPVELRLSTAQALLQQALALGDFQRTLRARARLAFERATLGNFDAYDLQVAEMLALAEEKQAARAKIRPLLMASLAAANRGNAAESDGYVAEAQQLLQLTDDASLSLAFQAHQLSRAVMLHRDAELRAAIPGFARLVQGIPESELTLLSLRAMVRARLELPEAAADVRGAWALAGPDLGAFLHIQAEAAAFVADAPQCRALHAKLLPQAGRDALGGHVSLSYEGPVDRLLGLLESALGQHEEAEQKLRRTLVLAQQRGFATWVAQGNYDLGNALARAGKYAEARERWQASASLAEACAMSGLVARAAARLGSVAPAPVTRSESLRMEREGELYRLVQGARSARIRATRGAELLARLVAAPGQEIHVLALAADDNVTLESSSGEALDRQALQQYRARLADIHAETEQANADADLGRVQALQREKAALERELSRAFGLGGKARHSGSSTERARVNVQRRLKDALERVAEASPELGAWLGRAVRTGTYCSFSPKT